MSAVSPGTLAAWLLWYVRWTARARVCSRRGWAAWEARRRGLPGLHSRYVALVRTGWRPIGDRMGLSVAALAARQREWEVRCAMSRRHSEGMVVWQDTGWAATLDWSDARTVTMRYPPQRERDARALAQAWRRQGVTVRLEEPGWGDMDAMRQAATLKRPRTEEVGRLRPQSREYSRQVTRRLTWAETSGGDTSGAAANGAEEAPADWTDQMDDDEELERAMERELDRDGDRAGAQQPFGDG